MTFDLGRIRHDAVLMHYSRTSNGSAAPSNWDLRATGDTGLVWMPPDSGASVSYGSNSNEVAVANAPGASSLASRADHVHKGVTSISHSSNSFSGPVTLALGEGLAITSNAYGIYTITARRREIVTNGEDVLVWQGADLVYEWGS